MKSERRDGHECCWLRFLLEIVGWQKILVAMAYYLLQLHKGWLKPLLGILKNQNLIKI
jgi:hypothetical protein